MLVLHVGNFGSRAKGAFLHSVAPKLTRGLVRAGHAVIDFADRDVARGGNFLGARKLGIAKANRELLAMARQARPDLLLLGHADTIAPATITTLRREMPALRVVQWNVDPLFEPDNVARLRSKLAVVDATLVSTAGAALAGLRHPGMALGFLPNPVDFSIESARADLAADLPYDLFYACGHPSRPLRHFFGIDWDMDDFVTELLRRVPETRPLLAGVQRRPGLHGAAYQTALGQCAAGLNASRRNDQYLYSSDRLAHMIGNGQAILMDRGTGYGDFFAEDQMAFFGSFDELAAWLRRLIAEPAARMAMAAAGRARYHALFNETRVARYVMEAAFGAVDRTAYEWPTLID